MNTSIEVAELRAESRTALRMGLNHAAHHTELVRRELHGRIARLERSRRTDIMETVAKHVPWVKIAAIFGLCILLATGVITAPQLKQLLLDHINRLI